MRVFAKRFFESQHQMPSRIDAAIYTAITDYLEAIKAAGMDDTAAVGKAMCAAPIDVLAIPRRCAPMGAVCSVRPDALPGEYAGRVEGPLGLLPAHPRHPGG